MLFLASLTTGIPSACAAPPHPIVADTLETIYRRGVPFAEFVAAATRRQDHWQRNAARAATPDSGLVARVAALGGEWYLLAVAPDGCSDSVNTIPWMAGLAARLDNVELRVVSVADGQGIMEAHRTPDGRAATPTVLLLDGSWQERGCFIERPRALRRHLETVERDARFERKMAWYEDDAGRETLADLVDLIETAARGGSRCE
jgi:hypothetical protein